MEDPESEGAAPPPGLSSLLPPREFLRSRKGQLLLAESVRTGHGAGGLREPPPGQRDPGGLRRTHLARAAPCAAEGREGQRLRADGKQPGETGEQLRGKTGEQ